MNPQQLLNGRGASAMSQQQQQQLNQSLNPALLLQMQGGNPMQAGLGGGMGSVGQGALSMSGMGNTAMAGMGGMNANTMGFTAQHLAQLQQMTPQQQMQAKLLVRKIDSDLSGVTIFLTNFPYSNNEHCNRGKWGR